VHPNPPTPAQAVRLICVTPGARGWSAIRKLSTNGYWRAFEGLLTGDFNGDGKSDLYFTGINSSGVVLFGNGNGTFGPPVDLTLFQQVGFVAAGVGDFSNDGRSDLAPPFRRPRRTTSHAVVPDTQLVDCLG